MATTRLIIVVDDEPGLARAVVRYIRQHIPQTTDLAVCQVRAFDHPQSVLDLLGTIGPNVSVFLITDGHMPCLNGDELILALRERYPEAVRDAFITSCHQMFGELAKPLRVEFLQGKAPDPEYWPRVKEAIEAFLAT